MHQIVELELTDCLVTSNVNGNHKYPILRRMRNHQRANRMWQHTQQTVSAVSKLHLLDVWELVFDGCLREHRCMLFSASPKPNTGD